MNFDEYAQSIGLSENEISANEWKVHRALWDAAQAQQREADAAIVEQSETLADKRNLNVMDAPTYPEDAKERAAHRQTAMNILRGNLAARIRAGGAK